MFISIPIISWRFAVSISESSKARKSKWRPIWATTKKSTGVYFPFSIEAGPKDRPDKQKIVIEKGEANIPVDDCHLSISPRKLRNNSPFMRFLISSFLAHVLALLSTRPRPRMRHIASATISGLDARNIGSATMSGRVSAIAATREPSGKITIFVGAASGGVWKSDDSGTRYRPVFDEQPVQSIGAIALDPKNPKNVWVGTGESWTRNSVSIGDGIYKSTDGGETWTNVGLAEIGTDRADRRQSEKQRHRLCRSAGRALERFARSRPL